MGSEDTHDFLCAVYLSFRSLPAIGCQASWFHQSTGRVLHELYRTSASLEQAFIHTRPGRNAKSTSRRLECRKQGLAQDTRQPVHLGRRRMSNAFPALSPCICPFVSRLIALRKFAHADANDSTGVAGPVLDPMQQAYIAENVRAGAGAGRDSTDPFANAGINFVEVELLILVCSNRT